MDGTIFTYKQETDVPMPDLTARIRESNFVWLNTNMSDIDKVLDVTTVQHDIVEVHHGPSGTTKKVGLLGLLTEDPSIYRPGVFGGAAIDPVLTCCSEYINQRGRDGLDPSSVDLIIPVTHQRMSDDRTFCEKFGGTLFPLVLGGHDHEAFDDVCNGSRIIKVGMDAVKTAIIDITWTSTTSTSSSETTAAGTILQQPPTIQIELVDTASFPPNPAVAERVQGHQRILQELEIAKLFRFEDWLPPNADDEGILFSTEQNRLRPNPYGTTILASILRMGMKCHCALLNGGNVRAARTYPSTQEWFTWKDLKAEIPYSAEFHAMHLPGHLIEAMINHSRNFARQDPPLAHGGYIHTCDKIDFDEDQTHTIRSIRGQAFDRNAMYLTALPSQWFEGLDNHVPLLEWAKTANVEVDSENGKPAKVVVVEVFASLLWLEMGSFDEIDTNSDGVLTREEVRVRAAEFFGIQVADLVVDNVFAVADSNQKGYITPLDMMVVRFVASDTLNHVVTQDELGVMQQVAAEVLEKRCSSDDVKNMVQAMYEVLDIDANGSISREEALSVIGEVKRRSLLM
jgi:Ca2+-binding EF-hand superfamily protein